MNITTLHEVIISLFTGLIMGTLRHASKYKHIKLPKKNKSSWNPGFLKDAIWGSIASITMYFVASPTEIKRIILLAIIAGYLGESMVDNLVARTVENLKYEEIKQTVKEIENTLEDKDKNN